MLSGCSFGDGSILIIPKNFKGYIVIIYNQKLGELPNKRVGKLYTNSFQWYLENTTCNKHRLERTN
jgi:hypothetical protein